MRPARAALAFLTRLPAGRLDAGDFARAPGWFAAVGLLVGALCAAVFAAAALIWPPTLAALIAVALGMIVTGALHEDGLADTVDGLGSGRPSERALEIMRDSRIGAFGALALMIVLGAKVAGLAAMPAAAPWVLIAAHALSRGAMTLVFRRARYLRATGAGMGMDAPLGASGLAAALGACTLAAGLLAATLGAGAALAAVLGAGLGTALIWAWAHRRLGGITGDVLGACQQMAELGVVLGVLACL